MKFLSPDFWLKQRKFPPKSGISVIETSDSECFKGLTIMTELTSARRSICTFLCTREVWHHWILTPTTDKWEAWPQKQSLVRPGSYRWSCTICSQNFTSYLKAFMYPFVVNPEMQNQQAVSWLFRDHCFANINQVHFFLYCNYVCTYKFSFNLSFKCKISKL